MSIVKAARFCIRLTQKYTNTQAQRHTINTPSAHGMPVYQIAVCVASAEVFDFKVNLRNTLDITIV